MENLGDDSLQKELMILNRLLKEKTESFDKKIVDDWQFVQE
jgi:hypothetical protein